MRVTRPSLATCKPLRAPGKSLKEGRRVRLSQYSTSCESEAMGEGWAAGRWRASRVSHGRLQVATRRGVPTVGTMSDGTKHLVDLVGQATEGFGQRPSWDEYFMATAKLIASRSNCERLHVGCVIVTAGDRKNRLVAAGYNGFLPGTPHVSRVRDNHEQATVHAEQNAIADAARRGSSVDGCT